MSESQKQYNYCLDFIKGIACVFVVFMHCEFPGIMGMAVQAISRFCVPFFFMVSGYYCFRPVESVTSAHKYRFQLAGGYCEK
ncbi:MAG: acyltransferase family protein [Paludibacteraceae bacterium]|nr:acyltransferase family protein [Paludibacteraceae bacterium]